MQGAYHRVLELLPLPVTPEWAKISWSGNVPPTALRPPWHFYNERLTDIFTLLFRNIAETRLGIAGASQDITDHLYEASKHWGVNEVDVAFDLLIAINDVSSISKFEQWVEFCSYLPLLTFEPLIWPLKSESNIVRTNHREVFHILFFEAALTLLKIGKDQIAETLLDKLSQEQRDVIEVLIQLPNSTEPLTEKQKISLKVWDNHQTVEYLLFERSFQNKTILYINILEGWFEINGTRQEIDKYNPRSIARVLAYLANDTKIQSSKEEIVAHAVPEKSESTIKVMIKEIRAAFGSDIIKTIPSYGYQFSENYVTITDLQEFRETAKTRPYETVQLIIKNILPESARSPFVVQQLVDIFDIAESSAFQKNDSKTVILINEMYMQYTELAFAKESKRKKELY
ncbi:hypothetical protein GCM10008957_30030 [Deinococcus ruber]|uniref:Uncharacterized protein n=2 Tax=Deinococcus ruber TaxID=1848197 RepID=A0A918CBU7_9DEIO|nr:hypothetical protein GCM10008957_30030 [Deinococcus ruber]